MTFLGLPIAICVTREAPAIMCFQVWDGLESQNIPNPSQLSSNKTININLYSINTSLFAMKMPRHHDNYQAIRQTYIPEKACTIKRKVPKRSISLENNPTETICLGKDCWEMCLGLPGYYGEWSTDSFASRPGACPIGYHRYVTWAMFTLLLFISWCFHGN